MLEITLFLFPILFYLTAKVYTNGLIKRRTLDPEQIKNWKKGVSGNLAMIQKALFVWIAAILLKHVPNRNQQVPEWLPQVVLYLELAILVLAILDLLFWVYNIMASPPADEE